MVGPEAWPEAGMYEGVGEASGGRDDERNLTLQCKVCS